jgi:hypothetical protein
MGTDLDTPVLGVADGIRETLEIVSPVDDLKGSIVSRLQTVFYPDQMVPGVFLQKLQDMQVDAIRPRPD